jgi:hypothetical protein
MHCPLLDYSPAAIYLNHHARERGGYERVDTNGGMRPWVDRKFLFGSDAVGRQDGESPDQLLAIPIRNDDIATDAVLATRRYAWAKPAAGERTSVSDRRHPGSSR